VIPADLAPAVLLYYDAPIDAEPVRVETQTAPHMLSDVPAAAGELARKRPVMVAEGDVPAVLAQLAAVGN
jgi:hypothetical protein